MQLLVGSWQKKIKEPSLVLATNYQLSTANYSRGFTLIETMVAISILLVAVITPMSLTVQALSSAYYARDQITAANLAQEAVETVRSVRDGNVLANAIGTPTDLLAGIPDTTGKPFIVDTTKGATDPLAMVLCPNSVCPPLQTNGALFGYSSGWSTTNFTRTVTATLVNGNVDEVRISVTVTWRTGQYQIRTFTLNEDLYRWINDGSGSN